MHRKPPGRFFIGVVLWAVFATLITSGNTEGAALSSEATLATQDTSVCIAAHDNSLTVISLRSKQTGWDWAVKSRAAIPLIRSVRSQGQDLPMNWRFTGKEITKGSPSRVTYLFTNNSPRLQLRSVWTAASGPGPIEHAITIQNLSGVKLLLPLQTSLIFSTTAPAGHALENWWVEKGAGFPTDIGTHRTKITTDFRASLISVPYTPDDPKLRDPIPWTVVQDIEGRQGWYAGIEFSGRTRIALNAAPHLPGAWLANLGLDPDLGSVPYATRLAPGETFAVPAAFVGCYAGEVDDGANRLHRWVETNVRPPVRDPRFPLLVNNSWGSGMAVDENLARHMIDDAAALGMEIYHVDAGWFNAVGDWFANPQKFPHGLAAVADYAHSKGLKFGLWIGWTQGGAAHEPFKNGAALSVFDPLRKDWFTRDYPPNWKTQEFVGADLCLSTLAAQQWCLRTLRRVTHDYKLDLLEHDQRLIVEACSRADHPHTNAPSDTAYRAANGYYHVYDTLRAENPNLLFEDCVNGGRTVDYGILRRTHYISITDTYTPLANRRAFYDASYALPPSSCECYIQNDPAASLAVFRAMLRSGMMGWCTIMLDMSKWSSEQRTAAARQFALFKTLLRPLIASGNLYHASERPDGVRWDGMQYADAQGKRAVVFAFRGSTSEERHTFPVRGLAPGAIYQVTFEDKSSPLLTRTGAALMREGVTVHLPNPRTSEIVILKLLKTNGSRFP